MSMRQDLAIVIPVWNLPEDLAFLLKQIAELGIFSEVIISDDASDRDCRPDNLGFSEKRLNARLVYLRSDRQRGAGHARNIGFQAVTAENILFFDADDRLTEALPEILQQHLEAGSPDFTIFRHSDTRVEAMEGRRGTFLSEEDLWSGALGAQAQGLLSFDQRAALCNISAYPWNKIYRTAFLRDEGISCSETPVHNDIRLHWLSFLRARKVLATRRIGAVHVIEDRDHHLTTRRGDVRLCLAGILAELTREIRAMPGKSIMMQQFIHFVDSICRWNLGHVDAELGPKFVKLAKDAYLDFRPEEFRLYAHRYPDRADAIVQFLLNEGA